MLRCLTNATQAGESAARAARDAAPPPPEECYRLGFGAPGVGGVRATADAPWYARAGSSLDAPPRDDSDSLPARVRRERLELAALRGRAPPPLAPPPPPRAALPPPPAAPPPRGASKKKSVEAMRAERVAREAAERRREAAVLAEALGGGGAAAAQGPGEPPGEKRYHAAFGHAPPRRGGAPYRRG